VRALHSQRQAAHGQADRKLNRPQRPGDELRVDQFRGGRNRKSADGHLSQHQHGEQGDVGMLRRHGEDIGRPQVSPQSAESEPKCIGAG